MEEGIGEGRMQSHVLTGNSGRKEAAIANTQAEVEQQVSKNNSDDKKDQPRPPVGQLSLTLRSITERGKT
jgi:hypothetical protein